MTFSIVLFLVSCSLYPIYLLVDFSDISHAEEWLALLTGTAMVGIILSIEAIFLNYGRIISKSKKRPTDFIGITISGLALILFFAYLVMKFVIRVHSRGGVIF